MTDTTTPELQQDEKASLQARLKQMNVKFHPNAGVDKLKELLASTLAGDTPDASTPDEGKDEGAEVELTTAQKRLKLKKEALALVRVRITCMNPAKKDWEGEFFTIGNSFIGIKRYVPFNAEDGWHVERILLNALKERKYQAFIKKKNKGGTSTVVTKLVPEFAIEILEPLTEDELKELAQQQAMAGSIDA